MAFKKNRLLRMILRRGSNKSGSLSDLPGIRHRHLGSHRSSLSIQHDHYHRHHHEHDHDHNAPHSKPQHRTSTTKHKHLPSEVEPPRHSHRVVHIQVPSDHRSFSSERSNSFPDEVHDPKVRHSLPPLKRAHEIITTSAFLIKPTPQPNGKKRYTILDNNQHHIFTIVENKMKASSTPVGNYHPFEMKGYDPTKTPMFRLDRSVQPATKCFSTHVSLLRVYVEQRHLVGSVKFKESFLKAVYEVTDPGGTVLFRIPRPLKSGTKVNYDIISVIDGRQKVGSISNQDPDLQSKGISIAVTFNTPDLSRTQKVVLLSATILISHIIVESARKRKCCKKKGQIVD